MGEQTTHIDLFKHQPPKVIAVIPAYNEGKHIDVIVKSVRLFIDHVIVVNDASSDNTAQKAQAAEAIVIDLQVNKGAGNATRLGCRKAMDLNADIIVTIDADGQHDPREIPSLLNPLLMLNVQFVFGGRPRTLSMPFENRFGNHLLSSITSYLLGIKVGDTLTGFRAFRADIFNKIEWQSNRYSFVSEMVFRIAKHKLSFSEVPVSTIYHDSKKGMRKRDGLKTLLLLFWWKIHI